MNVLVRASWTRAAAIRPLCDRPWRRCLVTTRSALSVQKSHYQDMELPTGNLVNMVFKNASKWSNKIATECSVTGRRYTYAQLLEGVARWGGLLERLGVTKGDVVGVALPNCPEYPIVLFGTLSVGAIVTTINPSYTSEEILRQLQDSEAKVLVGNPEMETKLLEALRLYKCPTHLVMNGPTATHGSLNLQQILDDPTIPFVDPVKLTGKEVATLPYSSGTTGPPKGVCLSHNAMSSNALCFSHPDVFGAMETTETLQECFMCLMPFYHIYGLIVFLSSGLYEGVKLLTVPKFDGNTYTNLIYQHKVKTLHLVPPILNFLVNSPDVTIEKMSLIRRIACGAAPVPPSAIHAFQERINMNALFHEGWGMTEVLITTIVPNGLKKIGTIGKLMPNVRAKVVDLTTGETLPANQDGEICIKTPSMMTCYHKNPKATAETIDPEGWLHTGDVGHFDEEGFFKIVDRTKELIKVKGMQMIGLLVALAAARPDPVAIPDPKPDPKPVLGPVLGLGLTGIGYSLGTVGQGLGSISTGLASLGYNIGSLGYGIQGYGRNLFGSGFGGLGLGGGNNYLGAGNNYGGAGNNYGGGTNNYGGGTNNYGGGGLFG